MAQLYTIGRPSTCVVSCLVTQVEYDVEWASVQKDVITLKQLVKELNKCRLI